MRYQAIALAITLQKVDASGITDHIETLRLHGFDHPHVHRASLPAPIA